MKKSLLNNINVFLCSSGTGKSYLAKINSNYIDMDFMKLQSKYIVNENLTSESIENFKGNHNFDRNPEFPDNYFRLIKSYINSGKKILLVPQKLEIDFLEKNNISYALFYPSPECANDYKNRFIKRGNSLKFAEGVVSMLNDFYIENNENKSASVKIALKPGEYLTDYLV